MNLRAAAAAGLLLFICSVNATHAAQEPRTTVIRFFGPVDKGSIDRLLTVVDDEIRKNTERLVLLISSPGGTIHDGLTAYNYLKGVPIELVTHNVGSTDSIAVMLLCAGDVRKSVPNARFVLHSPSLTIQSQAALSFDERRLSEQLENLQADSQNIARVIAATTGRSIDKVKAAIFDGTVLSPQDAKEWGLISEISDVLYPKGTPVIAITSASTSEKPTAPMAYVGTFRETSFTASAVTEVVTPTHGTITESR